MEVIYPKAVDEKKVWENIGLFITGKCAGRELTSDFFFYEGMMVSPVYAGTRLIHTGEYPFEVFVAFYTRSKHNTTHNFVCKAEIMGTNDSSAVIKYVDENIKSIMTKLGKDFEATFATCKTQLEKDLSAEKQVDNTVT